MPQPQTQLREELLEPLDEDEPEDLEEDEPDELDEVQADNAADMVGNGPSSAVIIIPYSVIVMVTAVAPPPQPIRLMKVNVMLTGSHVADAAVNVDGLSDTSSFHVPGASQLNLMENMTAGNVLHGAPVPAHPEGFRTVP